MTHFPAKIHIYLKNFHIKISGCSFCFLCEQRRLRLCFSCVCVTLLFLHGCESFPAFCFLWFWSVLVGSGLPSPRSSCVCLQLSSQSRLCGGWQRKDERGRNVRRENGSDVRQQNISGRCRTLLLLRFADNRWSFDLKLFLSRNAAEKPRLCQEGFRTATAPPTILQSEEQTCFYLWKDV